MKSCEYDRVKHIDIAKGISICLVAMFHSKMKFYFPDIIEPMALFRMPLFFFLSGIFFSWRKNAADFVFTKADSLLKPYFTILVFIFFLSSVFGGDNLFLHFIGIFYGNGDTLRWSALWFLTHLFVVYLFSFVFFRLCHQFKIERPYILSLLLFLFVLGAINVDFFWLIKADFISSGFFLPGLPFSVDIIFITSFYFILGYLLKKLIIDFKPDFILFCFAFVLFYLVVTFTTAHIDLNKRIYEDPFYATIGALSGIYVVIYISYVISKSSVFSNFFSILGKASLFILIFHSIIQRTSFKALSELSDDLSYLSIVSFFSFCLSIWFSLIIKRIVDGNLYLSFFFLPRKMKITTNQYS